MLRWKAHENILTLPGDIKVDMMTVESFSWNVLYFLGFKHGSVCSDMSNSGCTHNILVLAQEWILIQFTVQLQTLLVEDLSDLLHMGTPFFSVPELSDSAHECSLFRVPLTETRWRMYSRIPIQLNLSLGNNWKYSSSELFNLLRCASVMDSP